MKRHGGEMITTGPIVLEAVEAFVDGCLNPSPRWKPGRLQWLTFRKHWKQIVEWLQRPELHEPSMGREWANPDGSVSRARFREIATDPPSPPSWDHMAAWLRPVLVEMGDPDPEIF